VEERSVPITEAGNPDRANLGSSPDYAGTNPAPALPDLPVLLDYYGVFGNTFLADWRNQKKNSLDPSAN
jgi:hypothetical protein